MAIWVKHDGDPRDHDAANTQALALVVPTQDNPPAIWYQIALWEKSVVRKSSCFLTQARASGAWPTS